MPENQRNPHPPSNVSEEQPDQEPIIEDQNSNPPEAAPGSQAEPDAAEIPIPSEADDELLCDHLLCVDDEPHEAHNSQQTVENYGKQDETSEYFLCSFSHQCKERSHRREYHQLTAEEQGLFKAAKEKEVANWLSTGTASRVLRHQLSPDQIRWICAWKPLDSGMTALTNPETHCIHT